MGSSHVEANTEWKAVTFGDPRLFRVATGGTPNTQKPEYYGGAIRWLKSGDVRGLYIDDTPHRISDQGVANSNAVVHPAGSVMLAMSGRGKTRGMTAVLRVPSACSQSVAAIIPLSDEVVPEYVHFNLVHRYDELRQLTGSEDRSGLNLGLIRSIGIRLPQRCVQEAISLALIRLSESVSARQRELDVERERKAALMEDLFTHGTRGEATKDSEVGLVPEGWRATVLRDVGEVAYGLTVNQIRKAASETAPYLTVANVTRGALRLEEVKHIGLLEGDEERFCLKRGDVLFVEGNGNPQLLGSAAVWNDELPFALHQNHLIRVRLNPASALPLWVMSYINSDRGRAQLLGKAKTSSGLHSINSRLIGALLVPLPELDEQQEIVDVLSACDAKIAALEREAALLEELFRAMLEELMTGRLSARPLIEETDDE